MGISTISRTISTEINAFNKWHPCEPEKGQKHAQSTQAFSQTHQRRIKTSIEEKDLKRASVNDTIDTTEFSAEEVDEPDEKLLLPLVIIHFMPRKLTNSCGFEAKGLKIAAVNDTIDTIELSAEAVDETDEKLLLPLQVIHFMPRK